MRNRLLLFIQIAALVLSTTRAISSHRESLLQILSKHPNGHLDPSVRRTFESHLNEYYASLGDGDKDDILFQIGSSVFNIDLPDSAKPQGPIPDYPPEKIEKEGCIIPFDYMKSFMKDVFLSYGIPEDRAETCSHVLIESDLRGIDSHGIGRLKSIYCDRMDQGILQPSPPIDIIRETDTTAMVDGNLGKFTMALDSSIERTWSIHFCFRFILLCPIAS